MERKMISALDLFRRYCGRYPRIGFGKLGFSGDVTDAGRFYLTLVRDGKRLDFKTKQLGYPYIDVLEAGMEIEARVKGASGVDPHLQLQEAYWERLRAEFLDGRRVYLRVYEKFFPNWYSVSLTDRPEFPVELRTWPAIKRGMCINPKGEAPRGYLHWTAFVPEGTPEHAAIAASLDVALRIKDSPMKVPAAEIRQLQEVFFKKLDQVPA